MKEKERGRRLALTNVTAKYINVSRATFWRQLKAGVWPKPIEINGSAYYDLDEIDETIDAMKAARYAQRCV